MFKMKNFEYIKDLNIIEMAHYIDEELYLYCKNRKCEDNCYNCTLHWLQETKV